MMQLGHRVSYPIHPTSVALPPRDHPVYSEHLTLDSSIALGPRSDQRVIIIIMHRTFTAWTVNSPLFPVESLVR